MEFRSNQFIGGFCREALPSLLRKCLLNQHLRGARQAGQSPTAPLQDRTRQTWARSARVEPPIRSWDCKVYCSDLIWSDRAGHVCECHALATCLPNPIRCCVRPCRQTSLARTWRLPITQVQVNAPPSTLSRHSRKHLTSAFSCSSSRNVALDPDRLRLESVDARSGTQCQGAISGSRMLARMETVECLCSHL